MGAKGRRSAEIVAAVRPVGGDLKLEALRAIAAGRRVELSEVMYVGDSITDVPPFAAVRAAGGVALSFNGNRYALAAAELAAAAADTRPARELALAFAAGGREGVLEAARAWPPASKPLPRVGLLAESEAALVHARLTPARTCAASASRASGLTVAGAGATRPSLHFRRGAL